MYFSQVFGVPTTAPIGMTPPPKPLPSAIRSGVDAVVLAAEHLAACAPCPTGPRRRPAWRRTGRRARAPRRGSPGGATLMPPSPWIGSMHHGGHPVAGEVAALQHHAPATSTSPNGTCVQSQQRQERLAEDGLRGAAERAERLAVEGADGADQVVAAGGEHRHLEAALDRLGAGVGEERVLEVARRDQRDQVREVGAQRVDQLLRVDRLLLELVARPPSAPCGWRWPMT